MLRQKIFMGAAVTLTCLMVVLWLAIRLLADSMALPALWKIILLAGAASVCLLTSLIWIFFAVAYRRPVFLRKPSPLSLSLVAYVFPVLALGFPLWLVMQAIPVPNDSIAAMWSSWLQPAPPWLFIGQAALLAAALMTWYVLPEKTWQRIFPLERPVWMISGLAGFGLWLMVVFVYSLSLRRVAMTFPEASAWNMPILPGFSSLWSVVEFLLVAVLGLVITPLSEEYLFRRLLLQSWRPRLGKTGAALASAALFATLQGRPLLWLPAFLFSLALTSLTEASGHLRVAIFAHMMFNILALCINWTILL